MELIYCGPKPAPGTGIPLPEGWPMANHDEPDEALAEAKVTSGNYRYANPPKPVIEPKAKPDGKEGTD